MGAARETFDAAKGTGRVSHGWKHGWIWAGPGEPPGGWDKYRKMHEHLGQAHHALTGIGSSPVADRVAQEGAAHHFAEAAKHAHEPKVAREITAAHKALSPAPVKAVKAVKAATPGAARAKLAKATPAVVPNIADLHAMSSRVAAEQALKGLTKIQLVDLAGKAGVAGTSGKTMAQLRTAIFDFTAGSKLYREGIAARGPSLGLPEFPHAATHLSQSDLEARIQAAYHAAPKRGDYVMLADLRSQLGNDIPRAQLDEALRQFGRKEHVFIYPHADQKNLTTADHAAALHIGGEAKHMIKVEALAASSPARGLNLSSEHKAVLTDIQRQGWAQVPNLMTHQGRLSDQRFDDLRRQGLIKRSGRIYTLTDSGRAHLGMPIEPKSTSGAARAKLAKATKATQAVIPGDLHSTLQSRTVADLRKIAYDTNFDLPGGMTKAGIVRYLVTTAQEHDARLGHTAGDPSYYRLLAAAQARR